MMAAIAPASNSTPSRSFWAAVVIFLLTFIALQYGWNHARGTALERLVIDDATVRTGAALISVLTPDIRARANGANIESIGGGISVLNGCEGTEVLFLLLAALVAYPFPPKLQLYGAIVGAVYTFLLNQIRLVGLFYLSRHDSDMFTQFHVLVAPLLMIVGTMAFFLFLLLWKRPTRARRPARQ